MRSVDKPKSKRTDQENSSSSSLFFSSKKNTLINVKNKSIQLNVRSRTMPDNE